MALLLMLAIPVVVLACTDPPAGGGDLPGDRGANEDPVDATSAPADASTDVDAARTEASAGDASTTDGG